MRNPGSDLTHAATWGHGTWARQQFGSARRRATTCARHACHQRARLVAKLDGRTVGLEITEWNDTDDISVDLTVELDEDGPFILLTGPESLDAVPNEAELRDLVADYLADPSASRYSDYN